MSLGSGFLKIHLPNSFETNLLGGASVHVSQQCQMHQLLLEVFQVMLWKTLWPVSWTTLWSFGVYVLLSKMNMLSSERFPALFWKRRVREILQTEMQWPRTPVLVATTAQKCKETVHKEPVVLQKKSFLSQHSQVAGVSVSTAPYFATVCVVFFMVLGSWLMMSCQVTQNLKIHDNFRKSTRHPGIILVSSMKFVEFITSLRAMLHATVHRVMQNSSAKVPPAVQRSIWLKSISCLGQEFPSSADPTSPTSHLRDSARLCETLRDSARLRDWDLNTTLF